MFFSKYSTQETNKSSGFTLVEMAIVLTVIGLLIAGILKGQELIHNSRLQETIQQVEAIKGATVTFVDMYSQIPGDMVNATARIPGCAIATGCLNGGGSGIIEGCWNCDVSPLVTENSQYWRQLTLVDLLASVEARPATIGWGVSHPATALGIGGFNIINRTAPGWQRTGHYIRSQAPVTGLPIDVTPSGNNVFSQSDARWIDQKIDDGVANTGDVIGEGSPGSFCQTTYRDGAGNIRDDTHNCVLFFRLSFGS